jgi:Zn-dependent protease
MNNTIQTLVIVFPILIISMTIHEMMHAFVSDKLGDDTARSMGRISFNPLVHIDPILTIALPLLLAITGAPIFGAAKPVQVNFSRLKYDEFGGALVGAVGPLTNLVIGVIAALILRSINVTSSLEYDILGYTVLINIGFFVFNSIPWPPLDGSRVLYAFAPRPLQEIMESIERMGISGLIVFMFFFYYFLSPIVGNLIEKLTSGLTSGLIH